MSIPLSLYPPMLMLSQAPVWVPLHALCPSLNPSTAALRLASLRRKVSGGGDTHWDPNPSLIPLSLHPPKFLLSEGSHDWLHRSIGMGGSLESYDFGCPLYSLQRLCTHATLHQLPVRLGAYKGMGDGGGSQYLSALIAAGPSAGPAPHLEQVLSRTHVDATPVHFSIPPPPHALAQSEVA